MLSGSLLFITYAYASMFQRIVGNESAKEKQTWIEWANLLNSCLETRPEESVPEELVKVFNNWTENAKQQISFIINQRIQLMADGLMSMEIYSSLSQINDIIGFCEYELHHKRYKNAAKSLSALANALESYFQSNTEFQRYNTICFNTLEEFIEGFILTNRLES